MLLINSGNTPLNHVNLKSVKLKLEVVRPAGKVCVLSKDDLFPQGCAISPPCTFFGARWRNGTPVKLAYASRCLENGIRNS